MEVVFFFKCIYFFIFLLFNLLRKIKSMFDKFIMKIVVGGLKYENLF